MWRGVGFIRQVKLMVVRFVRLRGLPEEIAKGVALGIFIGMAPRYLEMTLSPIGASGAKRSTSSRRRSMDTSSEVAVSIVCSPPPSMGLRPENLPVCISSMLTVKLPA